MVDYTTPIAESNNFIVLDKYTRDWMVCETYQSEQARIVAILDSFDALTTSITEGLPREIELRKKQYEYYRNMLLSFPKAEA